MEVKGPTRFKQLVLSHLRQVKGSLSLAILCMLGFTLTEVMAPWPLKIIFDHILLDKPLPSALSFLGGLFQNGKFFALIFISSAIILIALFRGIFSYSKLYLTSRIGYEAVYLLRRELFSHLQRLSLSFHNRARSGELLTKVTGDTNALRDVFAESALLFASHLLTVLGMFVIMFAMNWKLSLIVLASFPLLFYGLFYLYGEIKASAKRQRKKEGMVASRIGEILTSIPMIQAFGRERYEEARFEAESAETLEESIRTARMGAAATRAVEVISAGGIWVAVLFGSLQVLKGKMAPGDVFVFVSYLTNMHKPIRDLAKLSTKFSKAMVSAERISEILEIEPSIQDRPDAVEASNLKGKIVFDRVSFDYGDGREILKDISFAISPGERVALVGASGAGKSTIVSLILRLYDPTRGTIFIDGVNTKDYRRESLRHEIGIVLQEALLFGTTLRENISYGKPDATVEEIEEAARQAHAHDFIMTFPEGYDAIVGERGSTLSGGQRQRISLARAIIKRPSILVLDEPTSAIDAESARLIEEAVDRMHKGKTCLVIVHQFSSIRHFDRILVLKEGELVEQGTHDALLKRKGYYYELFRLQGL
ncbi:ABC transporter ATP-binding protein [Candidatus Manganitrophus noduliformans]|uniref:ABC transporter ATP-binding protein n=1 Tax=Candidatus Manganitrophus noduliformans TaxID=2606439 RepID=A0A7X6IDB7_9BACT|nr:ABC transporter ATP-binding protein [Candidatus Manganitrophus noduliformans]NKE73751.1 ABC transporter ATP-binding protein [Candidatus Manganitrophus noduliformans]